VGKCADILADLSKVSLCEEADLDGETLEDKADGEGEEQHPEELVAGVGPTLKVSLKVPRVDIGNSDEESCTRVPQEALPSGALPWRPGSQGN
jgi:hypothetical protein